MSHSESLMAHPIQYLTFPGRGVLGASEANISSMAITVIPPLL